MLMLLISYPTTTTAMNQTKTEESWTFQGQDCTKPRQLKSFRMDKESCMALPPDPGIESTYSILQEQDSHDATGYRCSKIVSRFTYVCHNNLVASQQRLASIPQIEITEELTTEECQRMAIGGIYRGPDHQDRVVKLDHTTIFNFHETGRQEVSGSTIICEGEQVKLGDRIIDGVVILDQVRISVRRIHLRFSTVRGTVVKEDHLSLPCPGYDHSCTISSATYIWGVIDATKYKRVQVIRAFIHEQEGQQVLISKEAKIRLVLGTAIQEQGHDYFRTKYPNIYVTAGEATYLDSFNSELLSLTSWVEARDDFITWSMENRMKTLMEGLEQSDCTQAQAQAQAQVTMAAHSEVGFLELEHNKFGVMLGEVMYSFSCQQVQVTPRPTEVCFKELPVYLGREEKYLTPLTRILVDHGTRVPCSALMPAKFKTNQGPWMAATPDLQVVATPKHMEQPILADPEEHVDMSEGGLYTSTQLEDFTRLVTYPKVRKAVKHNMISSVCTNNKHKLCQDFNQAFGTVKPADVVSVFNLRSTILGYIHDFGEAAAAVIGVYVIVRAVMFVATAIVNCFNLQALPIQTRLLRVLWPTEMVNRDYGQQAARVAHERELKEAQYQEELRDMRTIQDLITDDEEEVKKPP